MVGVVHSRLIGRSSGLWVEPVSLVVSGSDLGDLVAVGCAAVADHFCQPCSEGIALARSCTFRSRDRARGQCQRHLIAVGGPWPRVVGARRILGWPASIRCRGSRRGTHIGAHAWRVGVVDPRSLDPRGIRDADP